MLKQGKLVKIALRIKPPFCKQNRTAIITLNNISTRDITFTVSKYVM